MLGQREHRSRRKVNERQSIIEELEGEKEAVEERLEHACEDVKVATIDKKVRLEVASSRHVLSLPLSYTRIISPCSLPDTVDASTCPSLPPAPLKFSPRHCTITAPSLHHHCPIPPPPGSARPRQSSPSKDGSLVQTSGAKRPRVRLLPHRGGRHDEHSGGEAAGGD